jgi:uncharacterized phage protein (TIGR01671 family)
MREIKFRAWNGKDKMVDIGGAVDHYKSWDVMQFTGRKDKNEKEIYEGDIVKIHCDYEDKEIDYYYGVVKFGEYSDEGESSWGYGWYFEDYYLISSERNLSGNTTILTESEFEIIGNVYENSEILDAFGGKKK